MIDFTVDIFAGIVDFFINILKLQSNKHALSNMLITSFILASNHSQ